MRKIVRLPAPIQFKIAAKELSASTGYLLADMDPAEHAAVLEEAGPSPSTTDVLKAARKNKVLHGPKALKAMEEKSCWTYLQENDANAKVKRLAATILQWRAGELPEPDFFASLHKLFEGK